MHTMSWDIKKWNTKAKKETYIYVTDYFKYMGSWDFQKYSVWANKDSVSK